MHGAHGVGGMGAWTRGCIGCPGLPGDMGWVLCVQLLACFPQCRARLLFDLIMCMCTSVPLCTTLQPVSHNPPAPAFAGIDGSSKLSNYFCQGGQMGVPHVYMGDPQTFVPNDFLTPSGWGPWQQGTSAPAPPQSYYPAPSAPHSAPHYPAPSHTTYAHAPYCAASFNYPAPSYPEPSPGYPGYPGYPAPSYPKSCPGYPAYPLPSYTKPSPCYPAYPCFPSLYYNPVPPSPMPRSSMPQYNPAPYSPRASCPPSPAHTVYEGITE